MVAVSISQLGKSFDETVVLDGVDVEVADGAFAVLVGPSGCGKSTLLRLIAGLERPTTGRIRFGQRDVTELAPRDRDVAMVFQSYALYPHLTVRDNMAFGLKLRKTPASAIAERVAEVSEMLGLNKLLERMPRQLSGGQRQRVAMGRAIARRPSLFLFDEPLSNLDAALRAQVRVDIRKLHERLGTTSVYVTHDQVEAMTLADEMFVLNGGRVEQAGAPLEVYEKPATKFVAGFLGSPAMNFLDGRLRHEDGWFAELGQGDSGQRVALDDTVFGDALEKDRAVTVGLRPHALEPAAGDEGLALELTFTEALGGETYAHGSLADVAVVARLDPEHRVKAGETLRVQIAPDQVQLFDAETGASLRC